MFATPVIFENITDKLFSLLKIILRKQLEKIWKTIENG